MKTYLLPKYLWVIEKFPLKNQQYIRPEFLFDYGLAELEKLNEYNITEFEIPALYLKIYEIKLEGKHEPRFYAISTANSGYLARNDSDDIIFKVKKSLEEFLLRAMQQVGGKQAEIRANYEDEIFLLPYPFNKPAIDKIVVDGVDVEVGDSALYINIYALSKYIENKILKDMEEISLDYTQERTWYSWVSF